MNIKTITTVDGVNVVDFGSAASRFYWIENLGSTVVYVSGNENIVPDGDNVKVLSAGCGTMVENLGGKVYILGAGKFQITNQGDKFPPFRNAPVNDGGEYYTKSESDERYPKTSDLSDVALTGNYSDLSGLPASLPANGGKSDKINVKSNTVRSDTMGLSCYHYETSASYTENYEIPTPYVDVIRLMFDASRGIEIAANWNASARRLWVRGNHTGWSDWTLLNQPYVTGSVSGTSGISMDINDLGFTPSFVICGTSSSAFIPTIITGGFRFTPSATTTYKYIAFK